ncbi:hypothetical protein C8R46DRAFT_1283988, partial [Mycena filopes]
RSSWFLPSTSALRHPWLIFLTGYGPRALAPDCSCESCYTQSFLALIAFRSLPSIALLSFPIHPILPLPSLPLGSLQTSLDLDTMPIWIVVHCQLVPVHHRRDPLRISNILSFSQLDVSSSVGTANPSTHPSISSMSFAACRYHEFPHTELRTDRIPALDPTVSPHWQLRALVKKPSCCSLHVALRIRVSHRSSHVDISLLCSRAALQLWVQAQLHSRRIVLPRSGSVQFKANIC